MNSPEDFLLFVLACLLTSAIASVFVVLWYRLTHRVWPDSDSVLFLVNLFLKVGTLAVIFGLVVELL